MGSVDKQCWEEFKETGLFWLINNMLHLFGWVIVIEKLGDKIIDVYPTRTTYLGFPEDINKKNLQKISKYIETNVEELYKAE